MSLATRKTAGCVTFSSGRQLSIYSWGNVADSLPQAKLLYRRLLRSLGRDAVAGASAAFNDGNAELSEQFSCFAASLAPEIKRSLPWFKLTCKRRLGLRGWRVLEALVEKGIGEWHGNR